jgi:hypothetical protein
MDLLPSIDEFPRNHPTSENPGFPNFPRNVQEIGLNLNADFQARKVRLLSFMEIIVAFKYDYVQLEEGFVPFNPATDIALKKWFPWLQSNGLLDFKLENP